MKKLFLNPFFIFWLYYFIGPFLTLPQITYISNSEFLFDENLLISKLIYHSTAYLSILPFILYISLYLKINNSIKSAPNLLKGTQSFLSSLIWAFIIFITYFTFKNIALILGPDYPRAVAYLQFLDLYHIITLIVLSLILIYTFLDKKYIILLSFVIIIFDTLMSRRNLMIFFFYPLLNKIRFKHLIYIFVFFSIFSIFRHRDNINFQFTDLYAPFFSESYMIFLSSVQFNGCPAHITNFLNYFNFERTFESCRTLNSGSGGFSSRFHYDLFFGFISVSIFTVFNTTLLFVLSKYINSRLQILLGTIIFVTLFIIFRDSLWNAQLFFFKYFSLLLLVSILIYILKETGFFKEKFKSNKLINKTI